MEKGLIVYDESDVRKCPICGKETDSLKEYVLIGFTFWIAMITTYRHDITACPKCMRKMIRTLLLRYLLRSNLLYPFVLLWNGIAYFKTSQKGHSNRIVYAG